MTTTVVVNVDEHFDLPSAVCSHGFFMLAPNAWRKLPESQLEVFCRPLRPALGNLVVATEVTQASTTPRQIQIKFSGELSAHHVEELTGQVKRMLRLSDDESLSIHQFQTLHEDARRERFGRLLRSPTCWEDIVKTITSCNCTWSRTVSMNIALVKEVGKGAFPTAEEVSAWSPARLQTECGLGYRALTIHKLAAQVAAGDIQLDEVCNTSLPDGVLVKQLQTLPGIGPYGAHTLMQTLGRFHRVPCDTETVRHLKMYHKLNNCSSQNVQQLAQQLYSKYAPFQFLAYWFELWTSYNQRFGAAASLPPKDYSLLTGHNMRKRQKTSTQQTGSK